MKQRYSEVNFFTTTLSSGATLTPATSGRTQIPLYSLPAISDNKYYHLIYKPTDIVNRTIYRAYNEGGKCYVDNQDVSTSKTFITKSQIAIFDVAEMFNELYKNVDDFGLVELFLSNNAKIRGGYVNFMGSNTLISDSVVTTLANGTWYAILDFTDSTLKFVSTFDGSTQYKFGTVVVTAGVGVYTDNRGLDIYRNRSILDKFSEYGGVLLYNGIPVGTGGNGDMIGPSGATPGSVAVFNGSSGKLVKEGTLVTDYMMPNNSQTSIPSEYASNMRSIYSEAVPFNVNWDPVSYVDTLKKVYMFSSTAIYERPRAPQHSSYKNGNNQVLNMTSLGTTTSVQQACVINGYLYAAGYSSSTTTTNVYKIALTADFSVAGNWSLIGSIAGGTYALRGFDGIYLCFIRTDVQGKTIYRYDLTMAHGTDLTFSSLQTGIDYGAIGIGKYVVRDTAGGSYKTYMFDSSGADISGCNGPIGATSGERNSYFFYKDVLFVRHYGSSGSTSYMDPVYKPVMF